MSHGGNPDAAFEFDEEKVERKTAENQLAGPLVIVIRISLRRLSKMLRGRFDLDTKFAA